MKASWEKIEKNVGVLTIEVEVERVTIALDQAFKKVSAKVNVPGFRKGKVPRSIFEAKFGVESLYQDALDLILPEVYVEAVEQTGISPVDRPKIDIDQFAKGQLLKFKAEVIVKPEVALGKYKGLEVQESSPSISAEEIDQELLRLQQRHAELIVIDDSPAMIGDVTTIDFEGFVDGIAFEGGKSDNYALELGSNSFIPGFEDQIVGMTAHEQKDIHVTFPESYQNEELQGKAAVFKVVVHAIKRKNLPELDDEFAKDISEFDTLAEYKQDIQEKLLAKKNNDLSATIENSLVDQVSAQAEVEIPLAMVNAEIEVMYKDFDRRLRSQGMNLELYFNFSGQDEDALKEQMRGDAEKRVRNQLVLEAVAIQENLTASDEEVQKELEKLALNYQRDVEEIRSIFTANGNLDGLKSDIVIKKTIDFMLAHSVKVTSS
jgi:trigger factor